MLGMGDKTDAVLMRRSQDGGQKGEGLDVAPRAKGQDDDGGGGRGRERHCVLLWLVDGGLLSGRGRHNFLLSTRQHLSVFVRGVYKCVGGVVVAGVRWGMRAGRNVRFLENTCRHFPSLFGCLLL